MVDLIQCLKLIEDHSKMSVHRLTHNHLEKVSEMRKIAIDVDSQLFFQAHLQLSAQYGLVIP